ncbi:unnamed protein product [Didymodactylos carnosus]|uniref:FAD-binding PCMH-type domain-containing protein n=1 Tax=Didymodactylos carnosus TaxID=1234261 RepID=A0A814WPD8_9BILA|nr:unnamed protein product [Didymodactylos carnosus]CAF1204979.1 unnamed protein product [Didymodactylos carnosus]CAF3819371.1 unnamed protein product [Didymodactylos carnosus]CAF3969335.1 unnamed protein product [Didymodactylos carnosus]
MFNSSIQGKLLQPLPSASSCHNPNFNQNQCNITQNNWFNAVWRGDQSGAMQNINWEADGNQTCLISSPKQTQCYQGSVPRYAVNATSASDIQKAVQFAANYNLRLVIKNTGHDYLGRSTAPGSLMIWTHYMKSISIIDNYIPDGCNISAISAVRVTAGVQGGEMYAALDAQNLVAVGGASATVGPVGGYVQGAGHGPLSRLHGLAADNVLQFEAVTADGVLRTANACQNKDLFWALRGGGGGTFAVVVSATFKTYPSPTIVGAIYAVTATNDSVYSSFITEFIRITPTLADAGWSGYFYLYPSRTFLMAYLMPNANVSYAEATLSSLLIGRSTNSGLSITGDVFFMPSFYSYFQALLLNANPTGTNAIIGSRLIPRSVVDNSPDQFAQTLLKIQPPSSTSGQVIGHLVAGGEVAMNNGTNTSLNPAWRKALLHVVYANGWSDTATLTEQSQIAVQVTTNVELLKNLTSDSGCYLNEADPNDPNWQQSFFGINYDRLKTIKDQIDPNGLFICKNCVGSEEWTNDLNCPSRATMKNNRVYFSILIVYLLFCCLK